MFTENEQSAQKIHTPKVLVGAITFTGEAYCRNEFFQSLQNLTYPVDFAFATNSGEEDALDLKKRAELFEGTTIITVTTPESKKVEDICAINREAVRQIFLDGDWTHLYFIDSDVMVPTNCIEASLQHNKTMVSGAYMNIVTGKDKHEGTQRALPVVWAKNPQGELVRASVTDLLIPRLIKIEEAGIGCCLIAREVLQTIKFKQMKDTQVSEDRMFFRDAKAAGYELWLDTRVKCNHLKYPAGDPNNKFYDWRSYQLQIKKKN